MDLPKSTQYLKGTTIDVPDTLSDLLPEHGLRVAYDVRNQSIYLILMQRKSNGSRWLVGALETEARTDADLLKEAKTLASNTEAHAAMLEAYLSSHGITASIREYRPPIHVIQHRLLEIGDTLAELMQSYQGSQCPWQTHLPKSGIQGLVGEIEGQGLASLGCQVLGEPICYLDRETANHPRISCADKCRVYLETRDLLGL